MPQTERYLLIHGAIENLMAVYGIGAGLVAVPQSQAKEMRRLKVDVETNDLDATAVAALWQAWADDSYEWREPPGSIRDTLVYRESRKEWGIALWLDEQNGKSVFAACTPADLKEFALLAELIDEAQQAAFRAFAQKQAGKLAQDNPY